MKNVLITCLAAVLTITSVHAASKIKVSVDDIARYQAQCDDAKAPAPAKAHYKILIHFRNGQNADPQTYDELKQTIGKICDSYGIKRNSRFYAVECYKIGTVDYPKFRNDVWKELSVKKDDDYWLLIYANSNTYINLSVDERFAIYEYLFSKADLHVKVYKNHKLINATINNIIKASSAIEDQTKIKDLLVKLNRKFSMLLLEDKTNWEPVVAKIRTVLETY